jgi:ATP-binding protein involved in chromosome partitioning
MSSGGAIENAPTLACDDGTDEIVQAVWQALGNVKDPCNVLSGHDLSIVDMGLVNRVQIDGDRVEVGVTFTEPGCLFGYRIIEDMEDLAASLTGVRKIQVIPEPFPLWDESRLSPRARSVYAEKKARFGQHPVSPSPIPATEQSP